MKKALIVGSLNVDLTAKVKNLPKLGETILSFNSYKSCGGKGANQAVVTAKLGLDTKMIGMVGYDEDGDLLIENLKLNKIKPSIMKSKTSTGKAIITVDDNGDNHIVVIPGSNFELKKEDIDYKIEDIKETDIVILQNEIPLETTMYTLEKAKEFGKITVFNPAPASKLDDRIYNFVDYLVVNETEFSYIFDIDINDEDLVEKVIKLKKEKNIKNLLITLGEKGSMIFSEDLSFKEFKAYKVKAVDTTAAGDSFIGAFCYKIANNFSSYDAISYATAVSAIVVTRFGAQDSIPEEEEVMTFISKN